MDPFPESRYIIHFFITILLCWLGWLCGVAIGQVGEAFTGSANFPDIGITCIANLAGFIKFILRGQSWIKKRSESAMAERLDHRLNKIDGVLGGWTTTSTGADSLLNCSVVMLCRMPRFSLLRRFMLYISNVYGVESIFLQCHRLQSVESVSKEIRSTCHCNHREGFQCQCIVFKTVENITIMLARRMPGTLKSLPDSLCLLPSLGCLRNGCHGCNQNLLHVENDMLREGGSEVESPAAVCEILDDESTHRKRTCICIPVRGSVNDDDWTNQLITFLKPDDKEFRGAVIRKGRTNASNALENYKNGNAAGECDAVEKYNFGSLIIVPCLTMAFINLVLTFWLKVDGFSSNIVATRAVQNYLSGKKYSFSPHLFLNGARVKSNANKTNVCQVLFFTGALQRVALSGIFEGSVVCICSIGWMVLVALEGGATKWYHTHSMAPSKCRVLVILVSICIAMIMDAFDLKLYLQLRRMHRHRFRGRKNTVMICAVIVLEMACIVACSAIAGVMGIKTFGRWIYSALQCLVLVKWSVGFLLTEKILRDLLSKGSLEYGEPTWWYGSCGLYIESSAFLLNATLAGVRAKWVL